MSNPEEYNEIVLFDGVCNFCDSSVQLILRKERKPILKFASLQSETGQKLIKQYGLDKGGIDSIVYISNGKARIKSTAALYLAKRLKGGYPLLFGFIIVPPFLRNWVYDWVARNRYKWFGKKDSCMIPSKEIRERFVDL
jgi:predicted DCC family thiol-disulfide oxidoreductase YuxK